MSYNTGTINSATPATAMMAAIQSLIHAHAAWDLVETVTTANGTTDVYKCFGTSNSWGTDFYVGIGRNAAGTSIGVFMGETYDGATKKLGKIVPFQTYQAALTVESDLSYLTSRHVVDESTIFASTAGFLRNAMSTGSQTGGVAPSINTNVPWFLSVSNDRIVFSFSGINATGFYAGVYDSFHAAGVTPSPIFVGMPICPFTSDPGPWNTIIGGPGQGGFTRDTLAGSIAGAFGGGVSVQPFTVPFQYNRGTGLTVSKETVSGKWWPTRALLYSASRQGGFVGLLKPDVLLLALGEVTEAVGDIISIDGVTYTCFQLGNLSGYGAATSGGPGATQYPSSAWVSQAA